MENAEIDILVRQECEVDHDSVYENVRSAFETMEMASGDDQYLLNRLRKSSAFIPELSQMAELEGQIIGPTMFTKMKSGVHPGPWRWHPQPNCPSTKNRAFVRS